MPSRLLSFTAMFVAAALPSPTHARYRLDIEYAEWGFDGRAVPGQFNLLTVEVRNSGDTAFEGPLTLRRLVTTSGAWVGAEHVEETFIGPFSQKLMHFYPYVMERSYEWELRWGPSVDDTFVVEKPALSNGARVIFNDEHRVSGIIPSLKGFREDMFPPTVTGTQALRAVAIDHTPRWEERRRRAFRDWLFLGGVLHVLHASSGEYPRLPVQELNGHDRPGRFGSGRIYWHDMTRAGLSRDWVKENIFATSRSPIEVSRPGNVSLDVDPTSKKYFTRLNEREFFEAHADWHPEEVIPDRLRELVTPAHNWPLIYVLSGLYLLLIFPGGVLLNRTRVDYRVSIVALVTIVGLWSWAFLAIGSRGYGESTSTCTTAALRKLPDGRWDVEQWSSLFVTTGDQYALTHTGESLVYSTAQTYEQIEGGIENGERGVLSVDMPPFTFRTFTHRTQLSAGDIDISIDSIDFTPPSDEMFDSDFKPLGSVHAQVRGRLPTTPVFGWVIYGDHLYELDVTPFQTGAGNLVVGEPQNAHEVVPVMDRRFKRFVGNVKEHPEAGLDRFSMWLMTRNMQIRRGLDIREFELPGDQVRLYLCGDLPAQLHAANATDPDARLGNQFGRVLYCIDVPLPQNDSARTQQAGI